MPPRPLTPFEQPYAAQVVADGVRDSFEYSCFIEAATGPLLELVTDRRDDRANPTQITLNFIASGHRPILHHNHLSQESLSFADWNGASVVFDEVFAHCADGTVYWGRVLDPSAVQALYGLASSIEQIAMTELFGVLANGPMAAALAFFFRKEVANRAMVLKGLVEYEYAWGTQNVAPYVRPGNAATPGPAGIIGTALNSHLDLAAAAAAPLF